MRHRNGAAPGKLTQLHGTDNAQNTYPSTGPRFLRRTIGVALAAGLVAIVALNGRLSLFCEHDRVDLFLMQIRETLR